MNRSPLYTFTVIVIAIVVLATFFAIIRPL